MALNVQPHLVQCEVVGLRQLLLVVRQRGLGLLHIEQVSPPEIDIEDTDQATLEKLIWWTNSYYTNIE